MTVIPFTSFRSFTEQFGNLPWTFWDLLLRESRAGENLRATEVLRFCRFLCIPFPRYPAPAGDCLGSRKISNKKGGQHRDFLHATRRWSSSGRIFRLPPGPFWLRQPLFAVLQWSPFSLKTPPQPQGGGRKVPSSFLLLFFGLPALTTGRNAPDVKAG